MTWLVLFVINALAVHRITRLVIDDKITEPARNWIFDHLGQPHSTWTYLFTCPWCVSIWAAAIAVAGMLWFPVIWLPVAVLLALSSAAAITYKVEDKI